MCLVIRYLADLLFCVIKSSTWNYRYLCPRPDTCTATVLLYNWPTRNIFLWIRFEHVGSALSAYPPGNENSESYGLRSPSLDLAVESCSQVQKRLHIAFLKTWEYWSVLRLLFYHNYIYLTGGPRTFCMDRTCRGRCSAFKTIQKYFCRKGPRSTIKLD